MCSSLKTFFLFFFNDTATTEIYTLSLHDALPISISRGRAASCIGAIARGCASCAPISMVQRSKPSWIPDRKSTRLNSSHLVISYAVFCLKKKKKPSLHTSSRHKLTHSDHADGSPH